VALCLIGVIGVVAIAVDGGVLLTEKRHAQAVADAAAMAASSDLLQNYAAYQGLDPNGTAKASALATAAANGYTNDGVTSTVTVNIPPKSGDYAGKAGYAEVLVQFNESRSFSKIFASGAIPVCARSVGVGKVISNPTAGILLLDPTGPGALTFSGKSVGLMGSPVVVNSSNSQAVSGSGQATLGAPEFDITGGYNLSGGSKMLGTIKTGQAPTPDPLASLPTPDPSNMPLQSSTKFSIQSGTYTLSPGVYQGGISISSSANVTLLPGVYYMQGGGFQISGGPVVMGNGVMIYNLPGGNSDTVSISGQATVKLSPPTSGTYEGLTFFQDRSSNVGADMTGGSTTNIYGSFYFAGATLKVVGNSSTAVIGSQYISKDLTLSGNADLKVDATARTATGQKVLNLVE
jgi:hypothetical protein